MAQCLGHRPLGQEATLHFNPVSKVEASLALRQHTRMGKSDPEQKTQLRFLPRVLSFQSLGQKPLGPWISFALLFLSSVVNSNPLLLSPQKGSGKARGEKYLALLPSSLLRGQGCLPGALFRGLRGRGIGPHLRPKAANQRAIPGTIDVSSSHLH